MKKVLHIFFPLYTATVLMLLGSGLLTTYIALRLASVNVSGMLIGAITTANYVGLVIGGKVGHFLIARVGHIRAYVSCAGIISAAVLAHGLTDFIPAWIVFRGIIGLCMMCQYMVLESWLNETAKSDQRGVVFGFYMAASYLGMALGQVVLMILPDLGREALMVIAMFFSLCLVPIALTTRTQAHQMSPAPMELKYFITEIPKIVAATLIIGMIVGSFYGLAPLYSSLKGMTTEQTGLFMALCITAGLLVQGPLGWLSDRYDRTVLIRMAALLLVAAALPLATIGDTSLYMVLGLGITVSLLQFSLYPLVVALANDRIDSERRVSLAACLLMAFGIGASIGPLAIGTAIELVGANMLYASFALCGMLLIGLSWIAPSNMVEMSEDAPLPHIAMPDSLMSSPLVTALDPRQDEQVILDTMQLEPEPTEEELAEQASAECEEEAKAADEEANKQTVDWHH